MRQEGQLLTTAPPSGQGNPIPYVLGNRNSSSTGFSPVACAGPKISSLWVGLENHLERAQPHARTLPAPASPNPHTPQSTLPTRSAEPWLHLRPLLFHPTLPGFPWDKWQKMTVWWLHKSILSAGCCWGVGLRVELSAMLSLKNCAGLCLCRRHDGTETERSELSHRLYF